MTRYLLEKLSDKLGLGAGHVEGKQKLVGKSGMVWEVDAKGVKSEDGAIVVIECRRLTTSRVKPEAMGGLAYRIGDVGASGAILVTPIGVQQGGQLIAEAEGIQVVHLDENSITGGYLLEFLGDVFVGPRGATLTLTGGVPDVTVMPAKPNE